MKTRRIPFSFVVGCNCICITGPALQKQRNAGYALQRKTGRPYGSSCTTTTTLPAVRYQSGYQRTDGDGCGARTISTESNNTNWDNFSTRGNSNPYTGRADQGPGTIQMKPGITAVVRQSRQAPRRAILHQRQRWKNLRAKTIILILKLLLSNLLTAFYSNKLNQKKQR